MAQVLLIGLGGTGSRIVNNVVADLKRSARRQGKDFSFDDGKMAFAVLDTNANDVEGITRSNTGITNIPICDDRKIKAYIKDYKSEGVLDWMPLSRGMLEQTMIDGASQMRAKSRLAFFDTIKSSCIDQLKQVINTMLENKELKQKIRVMIVSSLAGGTGSGMFIQTALWVRKYLDEHEAISTIRGVLVLPDVFITTIKDIETSKDEKKNLYANAYGAIRELNAITKIKEKGIQPELPIRLDGLFDSNDKSMDGRPVYDYVFFIDNISASGTEMKTIEEYESFISKVIYMQLYAPMKDNLYSEEDNLFKIFHDCEEPIFGSCGASRAVYPTESMLEYCSLNASLESVSSGWMKIDDQIDRMERKRREREKEGYNPEPLDKKAEYIRIFDDEISKKGTQVGANRLFKAIEHDIMHPIIQDNGEKIITEWVDKTENFVETLERLVSETVDTLFHTDFASIDAEDSLKDIHSQVDAMEFYTSITDSVNSLIDKIDKNIPRQADTLLEKILPVDMGDVNVRNDLSVYGFLTQRGENNEAVFAHPLAVRYLLYKLTIRLNEVKKNLNVDGARRDAKQGFRGDSNPVDFDVPWTKELEEDAEDYINVVLKWYHREKKYIANFKEKYAQFNRTQQELCRKYAIYLLSFHLFNLITERMGVLIEEVDHFFRDLYKVAATLNDKIRKNIESTAKVTQRTIYVNASEDCKKQMYDSISGDYRENNADINNIVVKLLYGSFCFKLNEKSKFNKEYESKDIVSYFTLNVVNAFQNELIKTHGSDIRLDLYTALKQQVDTEEKKNKVRNQSDSDVLDIDFDNGVVLSENVMQIKYDSAMSSLCDRLHFLAAPCLRYDDSITLEKDEHLNSGELSSKEETSFDSHEPSVKQKTFWGFNPVLPAKFPALGAKLGISVKLQQNDSYNINELNCYRGIYGIMAKYIPKLKETPDSDYYKNYQNAVNQIIANVMDEKEESIIGTPHIDKTWHYVLPYVTQEKQKEIENEFYKSFWMALAYSYVTLNSDGQFQTSVRRKKSIGGDYMDTELLFFNGRTIDFRRIGNLIKALRLDPKFVYDTRRTLADYLEMDRRLDRDQYDRLALIGGTERIWFNEGQKKKYHEGGLASKGFSNAVTIITKYSQQPDSISAIVANLIDSLYDLIRDVLRDDFADDEDEELDRECTRLCVKIYENSEEPGKENIRGFQDWLTKTYK